MEKEQKKPIKVLVNLSNGHDVIIIIALNREWRESENETCTCCTFGPQKKSKRKTKPSKVEGSCHQKEALVRN